MPVMRKKSGVRRRRAWRNQIQTASELIGTLQSIKDELEKFLGNSDLDVESLADIVAEMADPRLVIFDLIRNHCKTDISQVYIDKKLEHLTKRHGESVVQAAAISKKVENLILCLHSEEELMRIEAAKYLATLGPSVISNLEWEMTMSEGPTKDHAENNRRMLFAIAATTALCNMEFPDKPPQLLLDLVSHGADEVRRLAVERLVEFDLEAVVDLLDAKTRKENDYGIKKTMSRYLWEHDRPEHVVFLMEEDQKGISRPKSTAQIDFLKDLCSEHEGSEDDFERAEIAQKLLARIGKQPCI
jgi:hypothetical protein